MRDLRFHMMSATGWPASWPFVLDRFAGFHAEPGSMLLAHRVELGRQVGPLEVVRLVSGSGVVALGNGVYRRLRAETELEDLPSTIERVPSWLLEVLGSAELERLEAFEPVALIEDRGRM